MNLLDIKNRIIGRGIAKSLETYIYDWINDAYNEIWNAYKWSFKKSTGTLTYTAGTQTYAKTLIGSDVGNIEYITGNNIRLERLTAFKADDNNPGGTIGSSNPTAYFERGNSIVLSPTFTTSGTLTVAYDKLKTDLTSGTDEPLIPAEWQQVIVELAWLSCMLLLLMLFFLSYLYIKHLMLYLTQPCL